MENYFEEHENDKYDWSTVNSLKRVEFWPSLLDLFWIALNAVHVPIHKGYR